MTRTARSFVLVLAVLLPVLVLVLAPSPGQAQGRADGSYPGTLACDALAVAGGAERDRITLDVANGRATYTRRVAKPAAGTETGSGTVAGGRLTLVGKGSGRGFSYEARYSGEIGGRGGILTGTQTWTRDGKSQSRSCQMTVGIGLT